MIKPINFTAKLIINDQNDPKALKKQDKKNLINTASRIDGAPITITLEKDTFKAPKSQEKVVHNYKVEQEKIIFEEKNLPFKTDLFKILSNELGKLNRIQNSKSTALIKKNNPQSTLDFKPTQKNKDQIISDILDNQTGCKISYFDPVLLKLLTPEQVKELVNIANNNIEDKHAHINIGGGLYKYGIKHNRHWANEKSASDQKYTHCMVRISDNIFERKQTVKIDAINKNALFNTIKKHLEQIASESKIESKVLYYKLKERIDNLEQRLLETLKNINKENTI